MSLKSKGSNAERQLLHMFWDAGWACLRSAGSGSMNHPSRIYWQAAEKATEELQLNAKPASLIKFIYHSTI